MKTPKLVVVSEPDSYSHSYDDCVANANRHNVVDRLRVSDVDRVAISDGLVVGQRVRHKQLQRQCERERDVLSVGQCEQQ